MIDVAPHDLETIKRILAKHVPFYEVRVFGSRATWTAKESSDLDLAIVGDTPVSFKTMAMLSADIEESAVPFTVDILDWHRISPEFRKIIDQHNEIIQPKHRNAGHPDGWRFLKVSEFAEVIGGGTPSTKKAEYWSDDIPWLTPKDLSEHEARYITRGERNISRLGLENSSAKLVPANTVLLTSRAPVGYVAIAKNPVTTNQGFRSLIAKKNVSPEFIYYLLLNNTDYLRSHASGSTFPEISGSTLSGLEFLMPRFQEQEAIAHILGTLDDLIDLNRQTNETLEQIARTFFNHYFSYSPNDELPGGWRVATLPEACEVNPSRPLRKGDVAPYLDMANMPTNSHRALNSYDREFNSGMRFLNDDTLVARITPCLENGKTCFVDFLGEGRIGWGSTEYIVLRPRPPLAPEYAYFLARTDDFRAFAISNMTGTSGRQRVPASCLDHYHVALPPSKNAHEFGDEVHPIMQAIKAIDEQSRTLSALRALLLPKLLSGEIRVSVPENEQIMEVS